MPSSPFVRVRHFRATAKRNIWKAKRKKSGIGALESSHEKTDKAAPDEAGQRHDQQGQEKMRCSESD